MKLTQPKPILRAVLLTLLASVQLTSAFYDPTVQRWINRDPIGETGFALVQYGRAGVIGSSQNPYLFLRNSPLIRIDAFGLSPQDVKDIIDAAKQCTKDLTDSGQRYPGSGTMNNFLSTCRRCYNGLGGNGPKPYLGCGEQADAVAKCLDMIVADDNWNFTILFTWGPGPHQFIVAHSDNPSDPVLYLDPWSGRFSPRPPSFWWVDDSWDAGGTLPRPR